MAPVITTEITHDDLDNLPFDSLGEPRITNVQQLSSYNWIEAPTPTIAVPGSPSLWSPPNGSLHLQQPDSGLQYINQNAARHPDSPLEPLFRALHITNPSFDLRGVDVVTDRNNLRKLLAFINPKFARGSKPVTFTMGIEIVGKTAIFDRRDPAASEVIQAGQFKGYGHEFEKACTRSQVNDSTGHHRIIAYRFGGLNFVVRHEVDGYAEATTTLASPEAAKQEGLPGIMRSLSISPLETSSPRAESARSKLTVRKEGKVVPLESILEIKTKNIKGTIYKKNVAPQLWISQTTKLVRAYYDWGQFSVIPEVEDVRPEVQSWEAEHNDDLLRLAKLVSRIISVVKEMGGKAVLEHNTQASKLVFHSKHGQMMLPRDLYSLWDQAGARRNDDMGNEGEDGHGR